MSITEFKTIPIELENYLKENGYVGLKIIPPRGICGLHQFAFTTGLVIGIDRYGYHGRYCYSNSMEARVALELWDGKEDPIGNWIKYKGYSEERSNKNLKY